MNPEPFREYSVRLTLAYTRYLETVRASFFPSAPRSTHTQADQPEQRWEDEGGKPK